MKSRTLFTIAAFFLITFATKAQSTPEAFLGLLPSIPTIDCNTESSRQSEAISTFQSQIDMVTEKLSQAIRLENQKNKNARLTKNVKGEAVAQSALSEKELNTVSDKKTGQSEKKRLTDKSVQNQTGFSMSDMQKVKNMSKTDRDKWAKENFGKVMQKKSEATEPYRANNNSMTKLAEEKQNIAQNLGYHYNKLQEMENELQAIAEQQRVIMENNIKRLELKYKDVNDGEDATKEDMKKLREKRKLIRDAKVEYCGKLTSRKIDYLVTYENVLKESILPDLKRMEEIDYQIRKITFAQAEESSVERLQAVKKYASKLESAYQYYVEVDKNDDKIE